MVRLAMVMGLVGVLGGCAITQPVLMRGPSGQIVRCDGAGAIQQGIWWRNAAINDCVEQYEAAGFGRLIGSPDRAASFVVREPDRRASRAGGSTYGPNCSEAEASERIQAGMSLTAVREVCGAQREP